MGILDVYIDDETLVRMKAVSQQTGRSVTDLAENALSEAALNFFRRKKDDPADQKLKRHSWSRGYGWMVCDDCGCRYRTGMAMKEYEQPDGRRTFQAEPCVPRVGTKTAHDTRTDSKDGS